MSFISVFRTFAVLLAIFAISTTGTPTKSLAKSKFVFANSSPYDTLDPHVIYDVGRVASRLNMYDGLMRWLDNPPKLTPWLAESYDISSDGKKYTFKLLHFALYVLVDADQCPLLLTPKSSKVGANLFKHRNNDGRKIRLGRTAVPLVRLLLGI